MQPIREKDPVAEPTDKVRPGTIEIRPVESRGDFALFVRLQRLLYDGMEGFRPRLDKEFREVLDRKRGPFFKHGRARYFLAFRDGRPVGRISAQIDDLAPAGAGFFGCLDAADDGEAVAALLSAAEDWLKGEGATVFRGPFMLSINGESGLMLEGQTSAPMIMMGWSPTYLAAHLERAGYRLVKRLYSYRLALDAEGENAHAASLRNRLVTGKNRMRGLRLHDLAGEAAIFSDVFNDAWADNWGFVPITAAEIGKMLGSLVMVLRPDSAVVFESDGKPIGFAMTLPNLSEIVQGFNGTLLPFNWLKFAIWALRKDATSVRVILFGVRRAMRSSVLGAAMPLVIIDELLRRSRTWKIREVEMGWVLEDNVQVRSLIEKVGGEVDKTYGVFEKGARGGRDEFESGGKAE